MATLKKKLFRKKQKYWSGPNKRRVRNYKVQLIKQMQEEGLISDAPEMLTFAGGPAHFERSVVARGITKEEHITTIQDPKYDKSSDSILRELIRTRNDLLPGMYIWPSSFRSFARHYKGDTCLIPSFNNSNRPTWHRMTNFRKEMFSFDEVPALPFEVLDIDLCGIFNETNATSIAELMHNQKLAEQGLLFINHLKGKDWGGGKTCAFAKRYFETCPFYNPLKIHDKDYDLHFNFEDEDAFNFFCYRYIVIPIFYVCEAFKAGYHLEIERLAEYSDRNEKNHGVTMLQWFFQFERTDVAYANLSKEDEEYKELHLGDIERLQRTIKRIDSLIYKRHVLIGNAAKQ